MGYNKLLDQIMDVEEEPKRYNALHLAAGIIQVIGWVSIIIHAILTILLAYPFIRMKIVEDLAVYALTFMVWILGSLFGVFIIAQGQLIDLLLGMSDDIHLTRKYLRRFGLHMARNKDE